MSRPFTARYPGACAGCGGKIKVGDTIVGALRKYYHGTGDGQGCAPSRDPQGDSEYWKGRQDVDRWRENKAIFGEEAAEAMELERELREGWDY